MLTTPTLLVLPFALSPFLLASAQQQQQLIKPNPEAPNQPPPDADELLPDTCTSAPQPLPADILAEYPNTIGGISPHEPLNIPDINVLARPPSVGEFESELKSTSNSTQHATDEELQNIDEVNCKGSFWCPWFNIGTHRYIEYLLQWMEAIPAFKSYVYVKDANIACAHLWDDARAYCVFLQGNIRPQGHNGEEIMGWMRMLLTKGCFGCGSAPVAKSGRAAEGGILTVNYVSSAVCNARKGMVICDPSVKPGEGNVQFSKRRGSRTV